MEKLSSAKLVPGAKKVGDCWYRPALIQYGRRLYRTWGSGGNTEDHLGGWQPHNVTGKMTIDNVRILEEEGIFPDRSSKKSSRDNANWLSLECVPIHEPIIMTRGMDSFNWAHQGHLPTYSSWGRMVSSPPKPLNQKRGMLNRKITYVLCSTSHLNCFISLLNLFTLPCLFAFFFKWHMANKLIFLKLNLD